MKKVFTTRTFDRAFDKLPRDIREAAGKKITLLRRNPRHSSLQSKKIAGVNNIREVAVAPGYRATLEPIPEGFLLRVIGKTGK